MQTQTFRLFEKLVNKSISNTVCQNKLSDVLVNVFCHVDDMPDYIQLKWDVLFNSVQDRDLFYNELDPVIKKYISVFGESEVMGRPIVSMYYNWTPNDKDSYSKECSICKQLAESLKVEVDVSDDTSKDLFDCKTDEYFESVKRCSYFIW